MSITLSSSFHCKHKKSTLLVYVTVQISFWLDILVCEISTHFVSPVHYFDTILENHNSIFTFSWQVLGRWQNNDQINVNLAFWPKHKISTLTSRLFQMAPHLLSVNDWNRLLQIIFLTFDLTLVLTLDHRDTRLPRSTIVLDSHVLTKGYCCYATSLLQ